MSQSTQESGAPAAWYVIYPKTFVLGLFLSCLGCVAAV